MPYKREQNTKQTKGETLKIHRSILAFYKATIIPMVRWSFVPAGFCLNLRDFWTPTTGTQAEVLDRIALPELPLEEPLFSDVDEVARIAGSSGRRRAPISGPAELAISLWEYVDQVAGACPLCGYADVKKECEKEESHQIAKNFCGDVVFFDDSGRILRELFRILLPFFVTTAPFAPNYTWPGTFRNLKQFDREDAGRDCPRDGCWGCP
jgi:hypothetical protein